MNDAITPRTPRSSDSRALRARIERHLESVQPDGDPRAQLLANVEGPISPALRELIEQPTRRAAVLLALIERGAGWTMLFTERAQHLPHHPGQVSFPGGRLAGRHEEPVDAALREAWEEVGLEPRHVAVAGSLGPLITGTGFIVTPVVGFVGGNFRPLPDPAEVAGVFEVPLDYLLDPANVRTTRRERHGTLFRVHELHYAGHVIWGATAAMLVTFRDLISNEKTK